MPDLDLLPGDGPTSVFPLLHDARGVLLNLGEPGRFDVTPWAARVKRVDAVHVGTWELPVVGEVTAPTAVLIRPDGHVAWVGRAQRPATLGCADDLVWAANVGIGVHSGELGHLFRLKPATCSG